MDKIMAGIAVDANLELLRDLCHTMKFGSLCALGGFIPYPVMSALEHFPGRFSAACRSGWRRRPKVSEHPRDVA